MSDDGPKDGSIDATAFQGITPNGASSLLEFFLWGFAFTMPLPHFPT